VSVRGKHGGLLGKGTVKRLWGVYYQGGNVHLEIEGNRNILPELGREKEPYLDMSRDREICPS
jgi:hypothetical protein